MQTVQMRAVQRQTVAKYQVAQPVQSVLALALKEKRAVQEGAGRLQERSLRVLSLQVLSLQVLSTGSTTGSTAAGSGLIGTALSGSAGVGCETGDADGAMTSSETASGATSGAASGTPPGICCSASPGSAESLF